MRSQRLLGSRVPSSTCIRFFVPNGYRRQIRERCKEGRQGKVVGTSLPKRKGEKKRIPRADSRTKRAWEGALAILPVICQERIVGETFLHRKSGKTFVVPPTMQTGQSEAKDDAC